jgi:hypothetical protein
MSRTPWTGDQPVIVRMEKFVEWTVLARETEVPGENLPHLPDPGANLGRRGGKPATNRFSYIAALRET